MKSVILLLTIKTGMSLRTLEQPRSVIFAQITKESVKLPQINSVVRTRRENGRPYNQSAFEHKRTRTEAGYSVQKSPNSPERQSEISKLQSVLKLSQSSILNTLSRKLTAIQKLHLVQGGAVRHVLYSGHIRIPTVHNDYHNSKTNGGYSRNKYGGIYPK